jgi:hypothetical protein
VQLARDAHHRSKDVCSHPSTRRMTATLRQLQLVGKPPRYLSPQDSRLSCLTLYLCWSTTLSLLRLMVVAFSYFTLRGGSLEICSKLVDYKSFAPTHTLSRSLARSLSPSLAWALSGWRWLD